MKRIRNYFGTLRSSGQSCKRFAGMFLPAAASECLIAALLYLPVSRYMFFDGNTIPWYVIVFTALLPFAAAAVKEERLRKLLKYISVSAAILFVMEIVLFNGKSFTSERTDITINGSELNAEGKYELSGDSLIIDNDGQSSVSFDSFPEGTRALIFRMRQEEAPEKSRFHVWLQMKDDNFTNEYQTVQEKYTMAMDEDCTFSFRPYGKLRSVRLSLNNMSKPVTIVSVRALSALPFRFSLMRFGVLLLICSLVSVIKVYSLHRITFSRKNRLHLLLVSAVTVLCTLSAIPFLPQTDPDDLRPEEKSEYDVNEKNDYGYNIYAQVFDSFQKGQLYLDIDANPGLEDLENVYCVNERAGSEIYYKWDFAYYKGKYYCYFGVAPVIALYYPYYFITGKLPTLGFTACFFSQTAILFICLTIYALIRLIAPRPNLLLLLLSMPAAVSCVGVLYVMNYSDMYMIPLASGMCFLFMCLWAGFTACRTKGKALRLILFFISGTALAFCAASRPGMALSAAVLIPFFLGVLLLYPDRNKT